MQFFTTLLLGEILRQRLLGVVESLSTMDDNPVSVWIDELRQADEIAALKVWEHFSARLHQSARNSLRAKTKRVYDEEDAVLSMFQSLCRGLAEGRFPDLHDRDSLWHLMLVMTGRKISNRHRHDQRQRRDDRRTLTDSVFSESHLDQGQQLGDGLLSREPTPEFIAELHETSERLFAAIDQPDLKEIALLRVEGYNDSEIADRLDCSRRTVQRRLTMIRQLWESQESLDE
ncbi:MAG: ECF-type sigma factor [Planctomycetota bacterium]